MVRWTVIHRDTGSKDQSFSLQGFLCCVPLQVSFPLFDVFEICLKFSSRKSLQESIVSRCVLIDFIFPGRPSIHLPSPRIVLNT